MKHIHAEEIHAWAEGYLIEKFQMFCCPKNKDDGRWVDCETPYWYKDQRYRIKSHEERYEAQD